MLPTKAMADRFSEALAHRDLEAITSLFAARVDWDMPGNVALAPWLGRRQTRDDVRAGFRLVSRICG